MRRGSVEYGPGTEADHEAVYQTLLHVFHGPDRDSFLGALSDPVYQPQHRLLARVDGKVVSHVHLTERQIRYGSATIPINGVMWVGTLPEFRGMGFAQNLMRLASDRATQGGAVLQALTTGMPQFYRPLGWGICGRQTFAQILSRNLPQVSDGVVEGRGGFWHVRPWRQVELGDLMALYDGQYARTTGSVVRSEEYWRWIIGRRYAHVIWVACQGETVRGYAFIKDHKILELAFDPAYPQAMRALLGRVRSEALERAYPEVSVYAPSDHPVMDVIRGSSGRIIDQEAYDGTVSMYHIPDLGRFLQGVLPELSRRAIESGTRAPPRAGALRRGRAVVDPCRCQECAGRAGEAQPAIPDAESVGPGPALDGSHRDRCGVRGGRLRRVDQHRDRCRPDPLPAGADLAQPARIAPRPDGYEHTGFYSRRARPRPDRAGRCTAAFFSKRSRSDHG